MNRGPIHLHIDELVLHGFDPAERHQIADGVERELQTLLAGHGVPAAWRAGPAQIETGAIYPARAASPATLGIQIARAMHGGAFR